MNKKIIITSIVLLVVSTLIITNLNNKEDNSKLTKTENMLSYTIDGNITSEKPTKGSKYIANKITCEKGTKVIWDNTNWEVEILNAETEDRCNIDFTENLSAVGYRITVVSNLDEIDSKSKVTVKNGEVIFYPKSGYEITGISGCSGVLEGNKIKVSDITNNETCTVTLTKIYTLYDKILSDKTTRPGKRTSFNSIFTTSNTKTLYTEDGNYTEGGETVYYFAGNATDNWVYFGGFYWRIIRTNEDKSIRLLYHGTSPDTKEGYITSESSNGFKYNNVSSNTVYVGWMYGTTGSLANNRGNTDESNAKITLDKWYTNNFSNNYENFISKTSIYCNDRSSSYYNSNAGSYNSDYNMQYAAYSRLAVSTKRPSFKCGNNQNGTLFESSQAIQDKFTVSTTTGNGNLSNPVGLMTADEIAYAGGVNDTNNASVYYYLNNLGESSTGGKTWWTMSPFFAYSNSNVCLFSIHGSDFPGRMNGESLTASNALRPVLSLKSCVTWASGDGTATNPYKVSLTNACSTAEN